MKKQGLIEKVTGEIALKMLRWAGDQALKRGDKHEATHCYQAVLVGNSLHRDFRCMLIQVHSATREGWKQDTDQRKARIAADEAEAGKD